MYLVLKGMQNNISLVQQMYAAYGKGDVSAILAHLADDVVWSSPAVEPMRWGGTRHGRQETIGFFEGLNEQLSDPSLEISEYIADGDHVATFGTFSATVRQTGRRLTSPIAHYFRFRNGKVAEYRNYADTATMVAELSRPAAASGSSASRA